MKEPQELMEQLEQFYLREEILALCNMAGVKLESEEGAEFLKQQLQFANRCLEVIQNHR